MPSGQTATITPSPSESGFPATAAPALPRGGKSAWLSRRAWGALLVAAGLALIADLASKHLAFRYVLDKPFQVVREEVVAKSTQDPRLINTLIPHHQPRVVIPELLDFTLVLNPGAVFGIGPGQRWFFIAFTVVALGFGLLMFARWTTARDRAAHVAIGLLIGGGLGNLYDRLTYACVRDFIHPLPGWNWPFGWTIRGNRAIWPYVSNVADLLLLIGIGILLVHLWRKDRAPARDAPSGAASSPA